MTDPRLPLFDDESGSPSAGEGTAGGTSVPDADARRFAESPLNNVVLEASAGTGKTTVLVNRYLNLLRAGVDPANILAVTFTRKAAAEMRDRIIDVLKRSATTDARDRVLWLSLRNRLGDVAISTIDAFCYNLLREFPLEADLDPGFTLADETEIARLVEETLDYTLRAVRARAASRADLALLLAQMAPARLRSGLSTLLGRRVVAEAAFERYVAGAGRGVSADEACRAHTREVLALIDRSRGLDEFLTKAPTDASFLVLSRDIERARQGLEEMSVPACRALFDGLIDCFLTKDRSARLRAKYFQVSFTTRAAFEWHRDTVKELAPSVERVCRSFNRSLNSVLARAMRTTLAIALEEYRRVLAEYDVLDFSEALTRSVGLLAQMDEFAQSRYRLESRYHHVLVDEFQDTSQLQWDLVSALVRSWGEGFGLVHEAPVPPTVFVVGDRKQSIYRFRDAEVAVLDRAAHEIAALRHEPTVRRWISTSFRSTPGLLAFFNALFHDVERAGRDDAFRYEDADRFPVTSSTVALGEQAVLGIVADEEPRACAQRVALEIARLLAEGRVRDPRTGVARAVRPKDIAILFRSRESHREFERALEQRGIPTYVYKGLGFFDADEVRDVTALMRFLAEPASNLRAAALMRSRLVGLSDAALAILAPRLAEALTADETVESAAALGPGDRARLRLAREAVREWLTQVDRMPPAELIDRALASCAYAYEMRGPRRLQARENLKKLRALVRRIQNRGYASLGRIADHVDRLSAGDESNAVLDALDAVSLMTIHAAKGLEFPVVFLVNLSRGVGSFPPPVRVLADGGLGEPVVGVSPYADEAAEEERRREREETKRLLYVAVTRARDILYLAALTKDGLFKPGPGSVGEILPQGLHSLFGAASRATSAAAQAEWTAQSGEQFAFRLCPSDAATVEVTAPQPTPPDRAEAVRQVGVEPASRATLRHRAVTDVLGDATRDTARGGRAEAALHGRLVHRLVAAGPLTLDRARELAERLLGAEPLELGAEERRATCAVAARSAVALLARTDVQSWVGGGESLFEVPFSMEWSTPEGVEVLRGVIDWVVRRPDDQIVVIEVKTGSPKPAHAQQLAVYVEAASRLFPGQAIDGHLAYCDQDW